MKKTILIAVILISAAQADDAVKPGSDYCNSVMVIEAQNYEANRKKVDLHMAEVIKDMSDYLKTIRSEERMIIGVEGSGSQRLKDLDLRAQDFRQKYAKNGFSPCPPQYLVEKESCVWSGEPSKNSNKMPVIKKGKMKSMELLHSSNMTRWAIFTHTDYSETGQSGRWTLEVKLSNPTQEAEEIKSQVQKYYLAPTLEEYLDKIADPKCLAGMDEPQINGDERVHGKDFSEKRENGKEPSKSKVSASKH
ncbi:MAG TPA: hypothetical protein VNJ08_13790 [Bacteriovoracaceae bacterium]|nr:hypothetical protein [Bacteriovoracaceae bacterium]